MMHKEIKESKKTVALVISLLTITLALYIYQFFKMNFGKNIAIEGGVEGISAQPHQVGRTAVSS